MNHSNATSFHGQPPKLTSEERDEMLNEATHNVAAKFAEYGIELSIDEMYTINDQLTAFVAGLPDDVLKIVD